MNHCSFMFFTVPGQFPSKERSLEHQENDKNDKRTLGMKKERHNLFITSLSNTWPNSLAAMGCFDCVVPHTFTVLMLFRCIQYYKPSRCCSFVIVNVSILSLSNEKSPKLNTKRTLGLKK